MSDRYIEIGIVFAVLAGLVTWILAIASWGFLVGVGFGWIPSVVVGLLVLFIWPLVAATIGAAALLVLWVVIRPEESKGEPPNTLGVRPSEVASVMSGRWYGNVLCGSDVTHIELAVTSAGALRLEGQISFASSGQNGRAAEQLFYGGVDSTGSIYLPGTAWVRRAEREDLLSISGRMLDSSTVMASVNLCGSTGFMLMRR